MNTHDGGNGAARAAYWLHRGLREQDVSSRMFVRTKVTNDNFVHAFEMPSGLSFWERARRRVLQERIEWAFSQYENTRPERAELFYDDRTPHRGHILDQSPSADLYQLHSIYGFVDHRGFFREVPSPVVWTLHDMNAFTGGCQYNVGCMRFRQSCGRCPQLGSHDERDLSRQVWERKKRAYEPMIEDDRLHIVCASQWMAAEARHSSLLADAQIHVIPYGLDTDTFSPRGPDRVRSPLGIPSDHRVVLFAATSVERTRKGFDLFAEAVATLPQENVTYVSVGEGEPELAEGLHHVHVGHIDNDPLLSIFYSMADVFVIPSRQEAFGLTALESMACGTPVVGFEVGGIPDMVRPGETGWLAEPEDVGELRDAIKAALRDDSQRAQMGMRCREVVENEYSVETYATAYRRLYECILSGEDA